MAGRPEKYVALTKHLNKIATEFRDGRDKPLEMTFQEIEALGVPLPASAYKYPAWWSNSNHSRPWTRAGFRPEAVDLTRKTLKFRYSRRDYSLKGIARKRARLEELKKEQPSGFRARFIRMEMNQLAKELDAPSDTNVFLGMADVSRPYASSGGVAEVGSPYASKEKCHPAFGSMKGLIHIVAGTDLTKPAADPKSWKPRG